MIGKVICVHKNLTFSAIVEFIFVNDIFTILLYNAYLLLNKHFFFGMEKFYSYKEKNSTRKRQSRETKYNTTIQRFSSITSIGAHLLILLINTLCLREFIFHIHSIT